MAQRYVGTRETGNNGGAVTQFMTPYGYRAGTSYCGLFVNHCYVVAGVRHGVKGPALAANWSVPSRAVVSRWGRVTKGKVPLAGDVALYRFSRTRIDHVELVINWPPDENYYWVIGGNTGNPAGPGEGVFAKRRPKVSCMVVNRIDFYN